MQKKLFFCWHLFSFECRKKWKIVALKKHAKNEEIEKKTIFMWMNE